VLCLINNEFYFYLILLLHLIHLSYLSNVFFTNLNLFCIDNARVIYRKIRYYKKVKQSHYRPGQVLRITGG